MSFATVSFGFQWFPLASLWFLIFREEVIIAFLMQPHAEFQKTQQNETRQRCEGSQNFSLRKGSLIEQTVRKLYANLPLLRVIRSASLKPPAETEAVQIEVLFLSPDYGPESASKNHRPTVLLLFLEAVFGPTFRPQKWAVFV
jgi:hypothetical protein